MTKAYGLLTCLILLMGSTKPQLETLARTIQVRVIDARETRTIQIPRPEKRLLGKLSNGMYFFPKWKVNVKTPSLLGPGATTRDEKGSNGAQVIFTDDLGSFYRVVVLDRGEYKLDEVLYVFKGIQEKEIIETTRGRELRVIDVEKMGAEIMILTEVKDGKTKIEPRIPDLLTANAVFQGKHLIVHVVAGIPIEDAAMMHGQIVKVRERLSAFLAGVELSDEKKR